jgi:hypothetical protein
MNKRSGMGFAWVNIGATAGKNGAFQWSRASITPDLLRAVGAVTVWWALLDQEVTRLATGSWLVEHPQERMPREFSRRAKYLRRVADDVYLNKLNEPDEHRQFYWFMKRVTDAQGLRDDVAHGLPGIATKGTRQFPALLIHPPSRPQEIKPLSTQKLNRLASEIEGLFDEMSGVTEALEVARFSALLSTFPQMRAGLPPEVLQRYSPDSRSPKLPRLSRPRPTFGV